MQMRSRISPALAAAVIAAALGLAGATGGRATPALQASAQDSGSRDAAAEVLKADAAFADSVAQRNRERFLSFLADATTFNGGTPNEIHGRDSVWEAWADFFDPNGPTLSWTPTRADVVGAGDLGFSTGRSLLRAKGPNGEMQERRGEYVTVWRKQADGSWKVVFDTGSTLPPSR